MAEKLPNLSGKTILISGATSGIGEWTAVKLAALGAQVVIHGRNPERCAAAAERVRRLSGSTQVAYLAADLSTSAGVRQLATAYRAKYSHLHVLINNAGAVFMRRQYNPEGIEMTFAVNHLSYFLLTLELLDLLIASAPARIVNVSSDIHRAHRLDFKHLDGGRFYLGWVAYGRSKLANLLFTYELARRLESRGVRDVTVNALHPGFVASNLFNRSGFLSRLLAPLLKYQAIRPEQGAETSVYLASSPQVEGMTAKYFVDKRPVASSPASYDLVAAARLWQISEELTGIK